MTDLHSLPIKASPITAIHWHLRMTGSTPSSALRLIFMVEVKVMVASGWQRWVVSCHVAAVSTKLNFAAIRFASDYPGYAVGRSRKRFGDASRPYSQSR